MIFVPVIWARFDFISC